MKKLSTFSFLFLFLSSVSKGAVIINSVDNEIRLGAGVKVDLEQNFPSCLSDFDPSDLVAEDTGGGNGSRDLQLVSEVIHDHQTLDEYTHVNVAAQARYLAYSGSGSYNSVEAKEFDREQITVGIRATVDYGRYYIKKPTLRPDLDLLSQKDVHAFYNQCGWEYAAGVIKGQGISIVLKTLDINDFSYKKVEAEASGSADVGKLSGSASAAFASVASSLMKFSALEVQIRGFGVGDLSTTTKVLKTEKDVKEIVNVISEMIGGIKPSQAVVTAYLTSPYPIAYQPYKGVLGEARKNNLMGMFSSFRNLTSDLVILRDYVSNDFRRQLGNLCDDKFKDYIGKDDFYLSCDGYIDYLESQVSVLGKAQAQLANEIARCANSDYTDLCRAKDVKEAIDLSRQNRYWPKTYRRMLRMAEYKKILEEIMKDRRGVNNGGRL